MILIPLVLLLSLCSSATLVTAKSASMLPTITPTSSPQPSPSPTTTPSTALPSDMLTSIPTSSPQPSPSPTTTPTTSEPTDSPQPSPSPTSTPSTSLPSSQPSTPPSNNPIPTLEPTDSPQPSPSPSKTVTTAEKLENAIDIVKSYLLEQEQSDSDTGPSPPSNSRPVMPLIFLGGQSNMQGFSDSAAGPYEREYPNGGPGLQLSTLLPILQESSVEKFQSLTQEIMKVESLVRNTTIAELEARALLDIQRRYPTIFNNELLEADNSISCSYTAMNWENSSKPIRPLRTASSLKAILYRGDPSRCGEPWGLELILGHILKTIPTPSTAAAASTNNIFDNSNNNPWTMIKLAAGSTELYKNWSRSYEEAYNTINGWTANVVPRLQLLTDRGKNRIHPECFSSKNNNGLYDCRWTAIVWFQGENDSFHYENAIHYKEHLTTFFADLRQEMFRNQKTIYTSSPNEIPIVVVGIGSWRSNTIYGQLVIKAQQEYCEDSSNNAIFIPTHEDLSPNYHHEAASMLILGDRVAQALSMLFSQNKNRAMGNKSADYSKSTGMSLSTKRSVPTSVWNAIEVMEEIQKQLKEDEIQTQKLGREGYYRYSND